MLLNSVKGRDGYGVDYVWLTTPALLWLLSSLRSLHDVNDEDNHDKKGNDEDDEPRSGKNPRGSEVERIHDSAKHNETH